MEWRKGRTGRGGLTKEDVPQQGEEEGGAGEKATLLGWELWAREIVGFEMIYRKGVLLCLLESGCSLVRGRDRE